MKDISVKVEYTDMQAAYHEAGHAVASYLVAIPFCLVTIDPDPRIECRPGVWWPDRVPPPQEDREACCRYYKDQLLIDFSGRIAKSRVRDPPFKFPSLGDDGRPSLTPHDTANGDLVAAWKGLSLREYYCQNCNGMLGNEQYEKVVSAYKDGEQCLLQPKNFVKIEALADALLKHRKLSYEAARNFLHGK